MRPPIGPWLRLLIVAAASCAACLGNSRCQGVGSMTMGDLGQVLELLHDSDARWRTLRSTGRAWSHNPRRNEIGERRFAAIRAGDPSGISWTGYVAVGDQPPEPDETDEGWRLWMHGRSRTRLERSTGSGMVTTVQDGPSWWSWSPYTGGRTNRGAANHHLGLGPAAALVDTALLVTALRLELEGSDTLMGRRVFQVRGLPRPRREHEPDPLSELGLGADDYLMSVDAERGILLRTEARLRGLPFFVIEMVEVAFDVDVPDETFTIHIPEGESFEDVSRRSRPSVPLRSRIFARNRRRFQRTRL